MCGATKASMRRIAAYRRPQSGLSISTLGARECYGETALDFGPASAKQPKPRAFFRAAKEREMENLIARVATAAELSPDVARKAVALIGDFIQREAPEEAVKELFEKAPVFPSIIASSTQTGGEGMGVGLKGLMGVASGAMGGGGLMALGLGIVEPWPRHGADPDARKGSLRLRARKGGRSGRGRNFRIDSRAFPIHLERGGVGRGRKALSRLYRSRLAQSG